VTSSTGQNEIQQSHTAVYLESQEARQHCSHTTPTRATRFHCSWNHQSEAVTGGPEEQAAFLGLASMCRWTAFLLDLPCMSHFHSNGHPLYEDALPSISQYGLMRSLGQLD